MMFREPTLWKDQNESAKQSFTHHFQNGKEHRVQEHVGFYGFLMFLFCYFKILESRERSDPASGENADGAIIVSHLVSLFILLSQLPLGGGGFRVTLLVHNYLSVKLYVLSIFASFHLEFS